ncbi:MAG: DUF1573 domain-containing protein, partial [Bacteroidales bacterium]|nr:DUF1573 domain-containing protein [Bacteroidales bacterium]
SGEVLRFKLKLGNQPGTINLVPSQAVVSAANGNSLATSVNNGRVTLLTPEIQVNTPSIDFGHIPIRSTYNNSISVTNSGNEPLTISEVIFSNDRFSSDFNGVTIPAEGNGNITVNFAPVDEGTVNEHVTIVSNSITGNQTVSLVADPFAVNELHVLQVSGYSDSIVTMALTMNNMSEISGMQCKFKMPSALEYVDGSFALSQRAVDHQTWSGMSNDTLTLIAFSMSNAIFSGNDDTIATFRVKLVGMSGWYYMQPIEPILSNVGGINKLSDSYAEYVIIRSPQIWCDNTLDMGSSSVTETVVSQFYVNNYGDAPLRIDNVVFNQLGFSVQNDLPLVIEQYQSAILNVAYNREQEGNFSANMQIQSNDPTNGVYNVTVSGTRYAPNCLTMSATANASYEDVTLAFDMDNYTDITAVQFDFSYPHRYYTVNTSDIVASSRINGHSLTAFQLNDSVYRVMLFSMSNNILSGHSGNVVSVTLHPKPETVAGTYSAFASGIVLSDVGGVNKLSCDAPSVSFTTVCPVVGSSFEQTICEGEYFDFNGTQLDESGTYTDTLMTVHGCDSIVTLVLTINHPLAELVEVTACDSYDWNGQTYTESGTYDKTFTASNGCDSIVTLHLTINNSVHSEFSISTSEPYSWNGVEYAVTGNYTQTLVTIAGCDSIVTLHLTMENSLQMDAESSMFYEDVVVSFDVNNSDDVTAVQFDFIYPYNAYSIETSDFVLTDRANGHSISVSQLNDSTCRVVVFSMQNSLIVGHSGTLVTATLHPLETTTAGTYIVYAENVSLVNVQGNNINTGSDPQVSFTTICPSQETYIEQSICEGESFEFFGQTLDTAGVYTETLQTVLGCDSIITLTLNVLPLPTYELNVSACEEYVWNDSIYNESGDYVQTFATTACDSIVTLHLTISHAVTYEFYDTTGAESYIWNDSIYTMSGDYV